MKNLSLLSCFLLTTYLLLAQVDQSMQFDTLKTESEVLAVVNDIDNRHFKFSFKPYEELDFFYFSKYIDIPKVADSLAIPKYQLVDFDQNGYTDLFIVGSDMLTNLTVELILDLGNHQTQTYHFLKLGMDCIFPRIKQVNEQAIIEYHYPLINYPNKNCELRKDSIVYHLGHLMEFNPHPKPKHIKRIEYEATGCLGHCPMFNMQINEAKEAVFLAKLFNYNRKNEQKRRKNGLKSYPQMKGVYKGKIKDKDYQHLLELINYTNLNDNENRGSFITTGSSKAILKIIYDDNQVFEISDYGKNCNYALKTIYYQIESLRLSQKWKKVN